MALTKVVYHEPVEDALLDGPIARNIEERGRAVGAGMRSRVAVRSGKLQGSIESRPAEVSRGADEVEVEVAADAVNAGYPYAIALEFGATHMDEDPFMIPALEEVIGNG